MQPASDQDWAPGPLRPSLAAGEVHVWRLDLAETDDEVLDLLCAEERARAARLSRARDRLLWSRSRGVLRTLLGRYLNMDGHAVRLTAGEHGKPELSPPGHTPSTKARVSFNLSHSGEVALYAFAPGVAVGVDVELLARRPFEAIALAARVFGQREAQRLERLEPATRRQEFLRLWTRHEAELKCVGVGIGAAAHTHDGRYQPWTAELELGPRAAAALAVAEQPRALRCWGLRLPDRRARDGTP